MKKCTKCGIEKPLTEFYKDRQKKDGHGSHCKLCNSKQGAKYHAENKEMNAKRAAKHYAENKEKIAKRGAKRYVENKEKIAKYYAENKEKIAKRGAKRYVEKKAEQPNCVYQIKNLENNKVYIGETIRGELRWKAHLCDLRANRHPNKLLQEDFDKYGREAFEWTILKEFEDGDKDNLLLEEARSIQQFITEDVEIYNLTLTIDQLRMLTENK